jgi:biopolymer transport protein TolR
MPQLSRSTQSTLADINMVPFIDVVLVLLIIFMITAPILQSGIEVDLPKTTFAKEINERKLVVTVDKNNLVYIGDTPVNIHNLANELKKQMKKPDQSVFLRADESISFGTFAKVIDTLRVSGISNISVVTEPISDRNRIH